MTDSNKGMMSSSPLRKVLHLVLLAIMLLTPFAKAATAESQTIAECKKAGFDPWQLACTTCDLLPKENIADCQKCCQAYKSISTKTHRYEAAIIGHAFMEGYFPEVKTMLDEDMDSVLEKKGKHRLQVKPIERGDGYYQQPSPSVIMFFDKMPRSFSTAGAVALQSEASEIIVLQGWKRDDIRDMLLALLPDV